MEEQAFLRAVGFKRSLTYNSEHARVYRIGDSRSVPSQAKCFNP
jgi:hypothetical protein